MRSSVRLLLSILGSFALMLLLTRFETVLHPWGLVILEVAGVGAVAGLLGRSAPLSALGSVVGGLAGTYLSLYTGIQLWNPSPIASDLLPIRLLMLGGTAAVGAVVGHIVRGVPAKGPEPIKTVEEPITQQPEVEKVTAPEQKPVMEQAASVVEAGHQAEYFEVQTRICKFCSSVIPAESVFCPMCGNKLVEV